MTDEAPGADRSNALEHPARQKRNRRMILLQSVIAAGFLIAIGFWVALNWSTVANTFLSMSLGAIAGGVLAATAGLGASAMAWRAVLRSLGQPAGIVPASVVYLVGQLAKFIPGGFWAFIYQVALGMRRGLAKTPTLLAGPIAAGVSLAMGAVACSFGLARLDIPLPWLYPILGALPVIAAIVWPPFVNRIVRWGLRVLRRGERDIRFTRIGIAEIIGWSLLSWFCYGLQLLLLVSGEQHPLTILGTTAIMAAAQSLGFLAFIFPSGIGVREGVIVAGLAGVVSPAVALTIALAARATSTMADLVAAGLARIIELVVTRTRPSAPG
ncbi:MAG TPA: YbhN family protein [Microbacteriaceae bacterium]|nr:YbhN family protein [Microbacteriaceae bacterium]